MKIKFVRKPQYGDWFAFRVYIDEVKKATLRFGKEYVFEGEPTGNIRITYIFSDEVVIPVSILKEDNVINLQFVQGTWMNSLQAIVTVNKTLVGIYDSESGSCQ